VLAWPTAVAALMLEPRGMGESEMQQNAYSVAVGVHLLTSRIMTSIRIGSPSAPLI